MTYVGIALVALVLLAGGGVALACGGWKMLDVRFEDDLPVSTAIGAVEVRGGSGSVDVTATTDTQVEVHRSVRYFKPFRGRPGATASIDGDVLRLGTDCGWFCVVDYRVSVPAGVRLRGEVASGGVRVTGLSGVDVKTGSGAIVLTRVGGDISVRSSSGSITGSDLRPVAIDAKTSSGDISLSLADRCDVRADTRSGDLALTVPDGGYRIETRTSSGGRRVGVVDDPSSPHHLDLRTSSGDITVTRR